MTYFLEYACAGLSQGRVQHHHCKDNGATVEVQQPPALLGANRFNLRFVLNSSACAVAAAPVKVRQRGEYVARLLHASAIAELRSVF